MIPIDLRKKIAVITGGSGALGRVMVRTLAEAGADITICYYRNASMKWCWRIFVIVPTNRL